MRRSARLAAAEPPQKDAGDSHPDSKAVQPPTKRQRTKSSSANDYWRATTRPRNHGKLAALTDMPIDVLYEIFSHLHPKQLLHLARLTKAFRATLMTRSAAGVWRSSLGGVEGLPAKPDGISEPQYVDMLWGKGCMFCGSINAACDKSWAACVRYCKKCEKQHLVAFGKLYKAHACLRKDKYFRTRPNFASTYRVLHPRTTIAAYSAEVSRLSAERKALRKWVTAKWKEMLARIAHGKSCDALLSRFRAEKEADIERRRDLRQREVELCLREEGWGHVLNMLPMDTLQEHKQVRLARTLTASEWRRMKPSVTALLRRMQRKHVARARGKQLQAAYSDFRHTKPFGTIWPGFGDVLKTEPIRHLIESPPDEKCSDEAMLGALTSLPHTFFDDWRARCDGELLSLVQRAIDRDSHTRELLGTDTATPGTLRLAVVVFSVENRVPGFSNCGAYLTYPDVLAWPHVCARPEGVAHYPWSIRRIRFRGRAMDVARQMVVLVGGDPRSMTVEEMDKLDPWFYDIGEGKDGRRTAYTWRGMLAHRSHDSDNAGRLALLEPAETLSARARLADQSVTYHNFHFLGPSLDGDALCAHCSGQFTMRQLLWADGHLYTEHGLSPCTRKDFKPAHNLDLAKLDYVPMPEPQASTANM